MTRRPVKVRQRPRSVLLVVAIAGVAVLAGCRSAGRAGATAQRGWDVGRAELIEWQPDDPSFGQGHAIEASALAVYQERLVVASETFGRLLLIDPAPPHAARVVALDVPRFAELEGLAIHGDTAYLSDEAHAAVYRVDLSSAADPLPVTSLRIEGIAVRGGKTGLEGVALDGTGRILYLLLERAESVRGGCVSLIFPLRIDGDRLVLHRAPLELPLDDCAWRLTALEMWRGRLLALRTQFPGERYELIEVDPNTGRTRLVLELSALLRDLEARGWGNNVEGLTVAPDGSLVMVADNAVTGPVAEIVPPPAGERALLLRIPPR